jgi:hypothetical protein
MTQQISLTETELKLIDAGSQMKLALKDTSNEEIFRSCINAFLSAARSVTFVMERESSDSPQLKSWYNNQINILGQTPLFRFFNSQRVYSIHKGVIQPKVKSHEIKEATFRYTQNNSAKIRPSGEIVIDSSAEIPVQALDIIGVTKFGKIWGWYFDSVEEYIPNNSGNVLNLCEQYFLALKKMVQLWAWKRRKLSAQIKDN